MNNTDLNLKEACRLAEESIAKQEIARVSEMPNFETSEDFDKRVNKIIRQNKNEKQTSQTENTPRATRRATRVFILVAALIAIFSVTATAVNPLHERIRNFFVETFSSGSLIQFDDSNSVRGTLYSEYTYIPKGYELVEKKSSDASERMLYKNDAGNEVVCVSRKNDPSLSSADSENLKAEEILINGYTAIYMGNDDFSQVMWSNGEYNYSISSNEPLSQRELIKIAESRENVY